MKCFLVLAFVAFVAVRGNYPVFESAGQLKELLIPVDIRVGSVIYRLRASDSDRDYPLHFDATDFGSYVVRVDTLQCSRNAKFCEANVYLERNLIVGQVFKFRFTVRDAKGDTTTAPAVIMGTAAPVDINVVFPHIPGIIVLPEDTKPGTELEYVIVRRNPELNKPATLEIRGVTEVSFGIMKTSKETTTGVIVLNTSLDFEVRNMYKMQIFATEIYTNKFLDSRNIAGFELIMVVEDVQDSPPIFTHIQPIIALGITLTVGDVVTKVMAIDGDKGTPRCIRYGLVSEGNPFTVFFNISRLSGEIRLAKPLKELSSIARSHQPVQLTIVAEEEILNEEEAHRWPAMSTTATVAFLLADAGNTPPYFDNDKYVCRLDENSPQGTALVFGDAYSAQVHDDDAGKQGVFSLTLEGNNGTFEISPSVAERKAYFTIRVRNRNMLDYESRQSLHFFIVAKELATGQNSLSTKADVIVYLNDVNDNRPQFESNIYRTQIPEDAAANTFLIEVNAKDADTGLAGKVHYTAIHGYKNASLTLNSITGAITISPDKHGFDREETSEYRMTVEARDMEGTGLLTSVPLVIRVLDVNDETPTFQDVPIQFSLTSDARNFTTKAFIKAIDKDAEPPNNVVKYEIISGNYDNKFQLNAETGELTIRAPSSVNTIRRKRQTATPSTVSAITVRAYDQGLPQRWSSTQVHIYPADVGHRITTFILPGRITSEREAGQILADITGGEVEILEIKPHYGERYTAQYTDLGKHLSDTEHRTMVTARVSYDAKPVVDIPKLYNHLQAIMGNDLETNSKVTRRKFEESGSGSFLIWFLLLLILLLIATVVFLLCYFWRCCPFYSTCYRNRKHQSKVNGVAQTVNSFSTGTQVVGNGQNGQMAEVSERREKRWTFYQGHRRNTSPPSVILITRKSSSAEETRNVRRERNAPSYIYKQPLEQKVVPSSDIFVQDIQDNEYRVLDPSKLNNIRRYEGDSRGSAMRRETSLRTAESTNVPRQQVFTKEGEAEILRLKTTTEGFASEKNASLAAEGKKLLMEKFLKSPRESQISFDSSGKETVIRQVPSESPIKMKQKEETVELYSKSQKLSVNGIRAPELDESGTTKSDSCIQNGRIPGKAEVSIPEERDKSVKVEETVKPTGSRVKLLEESRHSRKDATTTWNPSSSSREELSAVVPEGTGSAFIESLFGLSDTEENRTRRLAVQRDILLTRFLVEEQRRLLNHVAADTRSLPGNLTLSTSTQTDSHKSTQTEMLGLLPEPRRAKSENDDSSDSEEERYGRYRFYSKRHKIKTPILEENENLCESGRQRGSGSGPTEKSRGFVKASSYDNIADYDRFLNSKEVYTPKSLKSRIIARRRSYTFSGDHKEASKLPQTDIEAKPARYMNWYKTKREQREKEKREQEEIRSRQKFRRTRVSPSPKTTPIEQRQYSSTTDIDIEQWKQTDDGGMAMTSTSLKLKPKSQQLLEKKSLFTIAYDDAATKHIVSSSNGGSQ